jgi:hypothetical protein
VLGGLPDAWRGPQRPAAEVEVPDVEATVAQIDPAALVPAADRANADAYADAQEVARGLARQMAAAEREGRSTVTLQLGPSYGSARDLGAVVAALRQIALGVRDALPGGAPGVRTIIVMFGDRATRHIFLTGAR